ncbi:MAG TPA: DUF418 domain-containing protein [Terriglobales bacterium]|nr:DUF418 domain-containing protein [Terriglobales bacterium]
MRPASTTERLVRLDILRGLALGGVLVVNLLTLFRISLAGHILGHDEPLGLGGTQLLQWVSTFIEFKAFTLFSFLFGVGVAIQIDRSPPNRRMAFLLRRFGALLAFGIGHMFLLWDGDILILYALCGLLLLVLVRLPNSALAVFGLLFIGLPYLVTLPISLPSEAGLSQLQSDALRTYGAGSWHQIFSFRLIEINSLVIPLLLLSFPRTLGLMLWGISAWRQGYLENNKSLWRWTALLGAAISVVCLVKQYGAIADITLAFTYASILFLWNFHSPRIAALGQMALTNYLLQSVVFGFVFYSYGLGMFGRVSVVAALVGGALLYCLQLEFSRWWMSHIAYGPVEWLWRSIAYLKWQPFWRNS